MAFKDRLKEARLKSGMTQEQLALKIGVAKSTFTGYEKGNREPNMLTISKILKELNIDANYLWQDETTFPFNLTYDEMENLVKKYHDLDPYGKKAVSSILNIEIERMKNSASLVKEEISEPNIGKRLINYYQRLASAGTGQIVFDTLPTELIEIPNIPSYRKANYAISVKGNSMFPLYNDNDVLLVEMTETIDIGEIGIFLTDGKSYVKKLGNKELISVNDEYDNIPLAEDSRCMGRVIGRL